MVIKNNSKEVTAVLQELQSQMAALAARMEKLEAAMTPPAAPVALEPVVETPAVPVAAPAPQAEAAPAAEEEEISEETLIVISAAVAAFLGERAHIRQVRLIRTRAWAQEGRVSIQASHRLH